VFLTTRRHTTLGDFTDTNFGGKEERGLYEIILSS